LKYTESQLKKVNKINRTIKKIDGRIYSLKSNITSIENNIKLLEADKFIENNKIHDIDKKVRSICKHNGERYRWKNLRDDASFDYYVGCKDCGEWIGTIEFTGEFKKK
jgi:hypothetical protein